MFNLSIQPIQLELVLKPGATYTHTYQITNNGDQTLFLNTSVEPWLPTDYSGHLTYQGIPANPNLQFSLGNADLKLGQTFRLPPHTSRQLVLKIKTQSQSPKTDSYYTFFINQAPNTTLQTQSSAQAKVGSHLLLSISNSATQATKSHINYLQAIPRIKDCLFTPITLSSQIDNLTDYFFKTQGHLSLSKSNQTITEIPIEPFNILSHHSRQISHTISPPLWPGQYTATLTLTSSDQIATASANFYVFPYSIFAGLILFAGLALIIKKIINKKP